VTQAPNRGRHPRGCRPRRRFCGARKQSGEDVSGIRRHTGDGCSGVGTSAGLLDKPMVKDPESPSHVASRHSRGCGVCRQADRLLLTPRLLDADIRWGFQKSAVPSAVLLLLPSPVNSPATPPRAPPETKKPPREPLLSAARGGFRSRGSGRSRTDDGGFAIRCLSHLATEPSHDRVLRYGTMGELVKFSLLRRRCRRLRETRICRTGLGIGR
jgi:hypothetical protein